MRENRTPKNSHKDARHRSTLIVWRKKLENAAA